MGRQGLGCINDNGDRFAYLCAFNDPVIGSSVSPYKAIRRATWIFLMVDHPTKLTTLQLAESGREASSDHHLLLGTLKVKLTAHRHLTSGPLCKYNTQNLKSKEISETFSCSVKNRYSALEFVEEHIDSHWTALKHTR